MTEAKEGVWTPHGIVTCVICHGPEFPHKTFEVDSEEWEYFKHPSELREGKAVTLCHYCKDEIQVYETVAREHNMVLRLQQAGVDATMAQTGGMNSAGEIPATYDSYYLFTWDFVGNDKWWLVLYDSEGEDLGEKYWLSTELDDILFEHIITLKDVKRN